MGVGGAGGGGGWRWGFEKDEWGAGVIEGLGELGSSFAANLFWISTMCVWTQSLAYFAYHIINQVSYSLIFSLCVRACLHLARCESVIVLH